MCTYSVHILTYIGRAGIGSLVWEASYSGAIATMLGPVWWPVQ